MSASEINWAARLLLIAKYHGAQFLDDPKGFDGLIGRGAFAQTDSGVLNVVRRIVKSVPNGPVQVGADFGNVSQHQSNDGLEGKRISS